MHDRLAMPPFSPPRLAARRFALVVVSLVLFGGSAIAAGATTTTTPSDPFSSAMGKIQELCKTFPAACPPGTATGSGSGSGAGSSSRSGGGTPAGAPSGSSQSWYYCSSPAGYYPYVKNCAHWQAVPTAPPGMH